MRLERRMHGMHAALFGQPVALPGVAAAACGDAVGPRVVATPAHRRQVIAGEALAGTQLRLGAMAILAAILVPREQERVGDLTAELAGDVNEFDEPDDRGLRQGDPRTSYGLTAVGLDDLRLSIDNQTQCPLHGHHRQGLEGRIEREATHGVSPLQGTLDSTGFPRVRSSGGTPMYDYAP